MKFELYTALRYLKSKKDNLFISKLLSISILTVALAIMVPIIVLSIVNGFHNSIKEKIIATNFEYRVRHRNNNFTQFKAVLKKIKSHPDVDLAIPFFESQGLIKKKGGDETFYVTVKGFYNKDLTINKLFTKHVKIQVSEPIYSQFEDEDYDPNDDDNDDNNDQANDDAEGDKIGSYIENNSVAIEAGKNTKIPPNNVITLIDTDIEEKERDEKICYTNRKGKEKPIPFQIKDVAGIVIGAALTNNIKVSKGDKIELLIPQGDLLYDANPDSMKTLKLTDIYSAGYAKFNKSLVFINFKAISEVFQFKNLPTDIGIHLKKGVSTSQFTSFLEDLIQENSDLILFNTLEESIFKDFDMEKSLMLFLLLFLVGSAFVTIYIAVRIVVLDKRVEIGILKAIGSKSKTIKTIFVVEGLMISFIGVIIGTVLGVLITVSLNEIICFIENTVHSIRLAAYKNAGDSSSMIDPSDYPWHIMDPSVFYLDKFPYSINYSDILLIGVGAIFVSIFAAYFLSKKESAQKTVDTLRF